MKREILFKAKRVDNGEWVEGFYSPVNIPIIGNMGHFINEGGFKAIEVHPETVCQFVGLLDKNGSKIFEWDKVKVSHPNLGSTISCVIYNNEFGRFELKMKVFANWDFHCIDEIEIIGNIHDK